MSLVGSATLHQVGICRASQSLYSSCKAVVLEERHCLRAYRNRRSCSTKINRPVVCAGDLDSSLDKVAGAVVALGKFDALHIGHRALAARAATLGVPFLLSFSGMAQILGWEPRLALVAKCDRARVLDSWATHCKGMIPGEVALRFGTVRHLSPSAFVELLARDLAVKGVVAGGNYRFGFKAAGDASQLVQLCECHSLAVSVVEPVLDPTSSAGGTGQVSSTLVRHALQRGHMGRVAELMGRKYRLLAPMSAVQDGPSLQISTLDVQNQPPGAGWYRCQCLAHNHERLNLAGVATELDVGEVQAYVGEHEISIHPSNSLRALDALEWTCISLEFLDDIQH